MPRRYDRASVRYVYTITTPRGVYIGCTLNARSRWNHHLWEARNPQGRQWQKKFYDTLEAAPEFCRFEVVACARDRWNGEHAEHLVIAQLIRDGAHVFNRRRRKNGPLNEAASSFAPTPAGA